MKSEVEDLKDEVNELKSEHKTLSHSVQQLRSIPSADDLEDLIEKLEDENEELRSRLQTLRSGDVEPVSAEEKERVDRELKAATNILNKRKKAFDVFWQEISQNACGSGGSTELWVKTPLLFFLHPHKFIYSHAHPQHTKNALLFHWTPSFSNLRHHLFFGEPVALGATVESRARYLLFAQCRWRKWRLSQQPRIIFWTNVKSPAFTKQLMKLFYNSIFELFSVAWKTKSSIRRYQ